MSHNESLSLEMLRDGTGAGAPAVVIGVVSCFLWSDKVLGEPFGIPANLIGIGLNCLTLFVVHQMMKRRVPSTGIYAPEVL